MPTYKVTSPEGRVVRLTGDSPPTEQELEEIFSKLGGSSLSGQIQPGIAHEPTQPRTLGQKISDTGQDIAKGIIETPVAVATGVVGGLTGLAGSIPMTAIKGDEEGRDFREYLGQKYSYQPKSETGKGAMNILGKVTYPLTLPRKLGEYIAGEQGGNLADVSLIGLGAKGKPSPKIAALESKISKSINKNIERAIRPSVKGKSTAPQYKSYLNKSQDAVKDIVSRKNELTFERGNDLVQGELPSSLKEFSDAIHQNKTAIFQEYNDMATKAGQGGATVNLKPIVEELTTAANNKVLNTLRPNAVKYILDTAERLNVSGSFTLVEAQEAIKHLNSSLTEFYAKPSPETASVAFVDASIAKGIRESLDSAVTKMEGPGYQALKSKYGAYKTIEADVTKRMAVHARRNIKGFFDISDAFSGFHLAKGLLDMNPNVIAAGGFAKAVSSFYKWLNDPDRQISSMFKNTEKLLNVVEKAKQGLPNKQRGPVKTGPNPKNFYDANRGGK